MNKIFEKKNPSYRRKKLCKIHVKEYIYNVNKHVSSCLTLTTRKFFVNMIIIRPVSGHYLIRPVLIVLCEMIRLYDRRWFMLLDNLINLVIYCTSLYSCGWPCMRVFPNVLTSFINFNIVIVNVVCLFFSVFYRNWMLLIGFVQNSIQFLYVDIRKKYCNKDDDAASSHTDYPIYPVIQEIWNIVYFCELSTKFIE